MCFSQGPPGVAGPPGPRGLPGNVVGLTYCRRMCNQYLLRLFVHKLRTDPTLSCRAYRGSLGLQVRLDREETRSVTYCDKLLYIWLDVIWKVFRLCSAWFWQCGAKIKLQRRGSDLARPPALFRQKSLWIHFNLAASLSKVFQNTFCLLWAFHFLCLLLFSTSCCHHCDLFALCVFQWAYNVPWRAETTHTI